MAKSLSMDLRERLISAVEGGMSRRSAAKLFRVAPSTAIKWVDQKRRTGSVRPRARGGDYRSHRLEAHVDEIVTLAKNSDITLAELVDHVLQTHGLTVALSTIWRLLDRHDMTFKKKPHTPPNSSGRMSCGGATPGLRPRSILSWNGWSSLTRQERRPRWPDAMDGLCAANAAEPLYRTATGKQRPSSARFGWTA
jgi:transposase